MSVKKILVLAAAGLGLAGATAALAGGPDMVPAEPAFQQNIYVQGDVGGASVNWRGFASGAFAGTTNQRISGNVVSNNGKGGFTAGAALGWNFMEHLSVEAGWFWLPRVSGRTGAATVSVPPNTAVDTNVSNVTVQSWFAYFAAKGDINLMDNLDLFAKLGVSYRRVGYEDTQVNTLVQFTGNKGGYWSPMFALGLQYHFSDAFYGDAQWMHVPGHNRAGRQSRNAPSANLFTLGLGYRFFI